jgi:hypothetical protein
MDHPCDQSFSISLQESLQIANELLKASKEKPNDNKKSIALWKWFQRELKELPPPPQKWPTHFHLFVR